MNDTFEHACRKADRKAAARPQDHRLERLRRLLESEVSLERAWHELNRGDGQAPQALVEALMYSLRERGVQALEEPDTKRRLSAVDKCQLKEVRRRVQNLKPHIATPWSREDTTTLVSNWRKLHGRPTHR